MHRPQVILSLLFCFLLLAPSSNSYSQEEARLFLAGAAAVDITPLTFPVISNGMFEQRSADRVVDRLMSRALVLDDGQTRLAIVVVDSLMIKRELLDEVKQMASRATGIPTERMLISATHTHSAPSVMGALGSDTDAAYAAFLPDKIAKSIALAAENIMPARIGWTAVKDEEHSHCRRWIFRPDRIGRDPFGTQNVRAHMHPGHQSKNHVGPAGPTDPDVSLLAVETADGKLLAVVGNYAMHYYGSPMVSADFCGRFGDQLAKLIGANSSSPRFVGMMSQGTSGDGMWMDYSRPAPVRDIDKYTEAVAGEAATAYRKIKFHDWVPLAMAEAKLRLSRRVPDADRLAWAKKTYPDPLDTPSTGHLGQQKIYAREALLMHAEPEVELKLQAIRIGELGITAIPNEVYAITGLKLKAQSPFATTFNIELANGAQGYIPPPEQHALGGYTTWPARTAGLEVEAEPKIVATLLKLLERVAKGQRKPLVDPPSDYAKKILAAKPLAFWRLGDMVPDKATDAVGRHHARFEGPVAMYLPGADGVGIAGGPRGNRAVHFAGGHVQASLDDLKDQYSVSLWFWNGLPTDVRGVTGTLFSRGEGDDCETLFIGGNAGPEAMGKLVFRVGKQEFVGSTRLRTKHWYQVVITRTRRTVSVYLDGDPKAEISETVAVAPTAASVVRIASDGKTDQTFEGKIDDVAIFNRVLGENEIVDHYSASKISPPLPSQSNQVIPAKPSVDAPVAPTIEQSLKQIHVRDGFKLELVAAEPLVKDPVAIDWGPDGKLWVVEMADYPLGIDGKGKPGGRIRYLQDTDGDGRYETSTLFADGLPFPTGILVWDRGVLVTAAPEIVYLEDTTGDGKADKRETLFSGFLEGNQQLRVNGLRLGLDNWVHCASGSHHAGYGKGNTITSHVTSTSIQVGSRDFRIRPLEGLIDPQSGPSQYGRNRDDWGNWFGVQNSHPLWHYVLADHYIRRNPNFAPPDPRWQVVTPTNPKVYPAKSPQKRFHSFDQSGRFTSACSAMIYRDELLFPRDGQQHAFTCEPFHNLVQHNVITDDGVSFRSARDPVEEALDFFASADRWCRPVMVRTGPDGALWVVDMYRYMIEHPQWLPDAGKDELRPFYRFGDDRGRIYRIVPNGQPPRKVPRFEQLSTRQLVAALESPNGPQRDTAQRMLVAKQDDAAIEPLARLSIESKQSLARLHALCTLDGLDALAAETLEAALGDQHPAVRRHAVRLSEHYPVGIARLVKLIDDPDAKVRIQLACTLGYFDDPEAGRALAELAGGVANDPYLIAAVTSSITQANMPHILAGAMSSQASRAGENLSDEMVELVFSQTAAVGDDKTIADAVEVATAVQNGQYQPWQFSALSQLLDGLARRGWSLDEHLNDSRLAKIDLAIARARTLAAASDASGPIRVAAVRLLLRERDNVQSDMQLVGRLLVPQTPNDVQQAIVARVAARREKQIAGVLLDGWRAHGPRLRAEILSILASRQAWVEIFMERLESGEVSAAEIDAPMRQRLLATKNKPLHARLQKAFSSVTSEDRQQILVKYESALQLTGDVKRGEAIFAKHCANCHRHAGTGHEVGPNLASLTTKTPQSLLTSILDPSAAVEAKYLNYIVITDDGRSFSGIIVTETGSSITLLAAEGKRQSLLRGEIEGLQSSGKSLMPDGIEKDLTTQDVADLIEFVRNLSTPK